MSVARAVGLLLGVAADAAIGDPRRWHPVAGFGSVAAATEQVLHRDRRAAGVAHTGLLVGGAAGLGVVVQRLTRDSPVLEAASTALVTWAVLGGSSLADEGAAMARLLDDGELDAARDRLRNLCGRDAAVLDGQGLARATVESIAENTSDAVVAPLFWGAVAGVPGLLGYRAANTLDAMVGHRSPRHRHFGWAAARLDDLLNLGPSRLAAMLTAVCAPVVGGSARGAWRTWRQDAAAHPSPNAGQIEAAFAGALQIRLGGRTIYGYVVEQRPVLGEGRTADAGDVTRGVELSRVIGTASAAAAAGTALLRALRR
ncbi:cobalamin biosynthesis protein [Saccharopolyspora cebuensis]|uniref:Cobalamin biosynthesis protein CobD n=1 Tax=Saccharopolyspora cebuensis TaxID=418759 RepID=A0ABV4CFA3_9PSEU